MTKPLWERLTFSGLQRYVKICDSVFDSDEHLSQGDRAQVIQNLLDTQKDPTTTEIEAYCKDYADKHLEQNMVAARLRNQSERGY